MGWRTALLRRGIRVTCSPILVNQIPVPVILGGGTGHRAESLAAACIGQFGQAPKTVSWRGFLADHQVLDRALDGAAWLRFETPDQDAAELAALYRAGAADAGRQGVPTMPTDCEALIASGAIGSPWQLSLGLQSALKAACAIAIKRGVGCSTTPHDMALAFDKVRAQAVFLEAGIPIPAAINPVEDFAALQAAMDRAQTSRVFIKLRHGAAASGMIALMRRGDKWRAITTARAGADGVLRSSRRLRTIEAPDEIAGLIDQLAPLGLHVEAWIPKIGICGRVADLRLVTLGGEVVSATVRTSSHPITNLHLGGDRLPARQLIEAVGDGVWSDICYTARRVASQFPGTESLGIDIAVSADGHRHYVLEANVFGDFVKDAGGDLSHLHSLAMRRIAERLITRHAA